ncbi:hypothetical protein GCM10027445_28880 [Amycolatopsis endophytica]|uniref:MEDS domain-containing protein n=1 Tax=Amycolatopsis endophytica TaxID=860233 RepID=A0A853B643_9PSEU|nr:MEDS domain-containing protein [Amycolatopsis endophytica]NYI90460.1 hypothetical protein [Amycolatopsis endophytica]
MRAAGPVDRPLGLGPQGHVCWAFDEHTEFRARAREFLAEGLSRGHQVWYVAAGDTATLAGHLRGMEGVDEALRTGAARLVSADGAYPVGTVVDPETQARGYAEATENALASGYTGLRVAADCTPLVVTPEQLAAFARYEHVMDQYMALRPFSAMCAYDRRRVGNDVVAQVACMHPAGNTSVDPGFRLFGSARYAAGLAGELDLATGARLAAALERADPRPVGGHLMVDASGLRFLDHKSLVRLDTFARAREATLVLRTSWPGATRLAGLLDLPSVRVEAIA